MKWLKLKKKLSKGTVVFIGAVVIATLSIFDFMLLYKKGYVGCMGNDISFCLNSNQYTGKSGMFSFRYPKNYPLSVKAGEELKRYTDDNVTEWVNFSNEWYPNAGGDRLGLVIVKREAEFDNVEDFTENVKSNFESIPEQYKGNPPVINFIKISGLDTVQIKTSIQPSSFDQPSDNYYIFHNGYKYRITFDYRNDYHKEPIEYYEKSKKLILSTFKINKTFQEESVDKQYKVFSNSYFPLTFEYPSDWERTTDGDENAWPLPTISETIESDNGCKLYFGFGGGDTPHSYQTSYQSITHIDGVKFDKKTWVKDGQPIFISYIEKEDVKNFELMLVSIPENNSQECVAETEHTIESIDFL